MYGYSFQYKHTMIWETFIAASGKKKTKLLHSLEETILKSLFNEQRTHSVAAGLAREKNTLHPGNASSPIVIGMLSRRGTATAAPNIFQVGCVSMPLSV